MTIKNKQKIIKFLKEIEIDLINSKEAIRNIKEEMEIIEKKFQENILKLHRLFKNNDTNIKK